LDLRSDLLEEDFAANGGAEDFMLSRRSSVADFRSSTSKLEVRESQRVSLLEESRPEKLRKLVNHTVNQLVVRYLR